MGSMRSGIVVIIMRIRRMDLGCIDGGMEAITRGSLGRISDMDRGR